MKFLSLNFWFNLRPGHLLPIYQNVLVIFLIILVITGIATFIIKKKKKKLYFRLWEKLFNFSSTNFFFGILLLFFNYEKIPFFSSRFWYLLWALGIAFWIKGLFKYFKSIPERKKEIEEEKAYKKYIP